MKIIKVTQYLFYLDAAIWVIIGLTSLVRLGNSENTPLVIQLMILILMAGNVLAMLLAGWVIERKNRLVYIFAVVVILVNFLLTFTDQFGIVDLATLLLDLVILALLVAGWKEFYRVADKNRQLERS